MARNMYTIHSVTNIMQNFPLLEPVALFLSLLMMVLTKCVRLFLIQFPAPEAICTENRVVHKNYRLSKVFRCVYFSVTKSGWSDNSVSTVSQTLWLCTNIMSVYKRVNSRSHDILFKNPAGRVPYFVTCFLKCYESTRSLNIFYIHFFLLFFSTPVIQSWTWVRFLDTECGCCSITKLAQA